MKEQPMRILAISSWWPEPADNGARLRIANLLQSLASRHDVHLLALAQEEVSQAQIRRVQQICRSVDLMPQRMYVPRRGEQIASLWNATPSSLRATWDPGFAALVQRRAAEIQPNMVIAFALGAAVYAPLVQGAPRIFEEVEVGSLYNDFTTAHSSRRRLRTWLTWTKHRSYMRRLLAQFNGATAVSASEEALIRPLLPPDATFTVVENGADVVGCESFIREPKPDTLIYPGALSYDPNFDAMQYFLGEIFPRIRRERPGVRLRITGKAHPERAAALPQIGGVELTGYVADVRPLIAGSWATVVPLRQGGGTRLKALESLALGTPLVTTSKGVEGIVLEDERHMLCADDAEGFARATLRLLGDPQLRAKLSADGRAVVAQRYDWRTIGANLCSFVEMIAAEARPVAV
jgi:glycosyltransferase involved in cell wall biosynthesis